MSEVAEWWVVGSIVTIAICIVLWKSGHPAAAAVFFYVSPFPIPPPFG